MLHPPRLLATDLVLCEYKIDCRLFYSPLSLPVASGRLERLKNDPVDVEHRVSSRWRNRCIEVLV